MVGVSAFSTLAGLPLVWGRSLPVSSGGRVSQVCTLFTRIKSLLLGTLVDIGLVTVTFS